jgi:hypothetical protein
MTDVKDEPRDKQFVKGYLPLGCKYIERTL